MSLRKKQSEFALAVSNLLQWAYENGYEVTLGDAYRDPRVHGEYGSEGGYGRQESCHKIRLAIDLNLFKDGKYLSSTEDHKPLGEFWETLHEDASWGGDFNDGNHYSFKHWGSR